MNPQIAFLLCAAVVFGALLYDARRAPLSGAVWIPTIWAALVASKPLGNWLDPVGSADLMVSADGSPLDRNVLVLLMVAAAVVLVRRKLPWSQLRREHVWIFAFFLFCGISIVWSDFPAVGFKRWVRSIGTVMVILVVASEKDPIAASAAVVRRCAIILLPFSVILIKYFREFGVAYGVWEGELTLVGVTTDKNALGRLALVCGLFLLWELVTGKNNPHVPATRLSRWSNASLLVVAVWLLLSSDSKTSLMCFVLGALVLLVASRPFVIKRAAYLGTLILAVAGTGLLLDLTFDIRGMVLQGLGRDPTLTDRTFIWADLLAWGTNPLVGVGYDTFWLGDRLTWFVQTHRVNEAHNGYLEAYLELGWVGLLLLWGLLLAVFAKLKAALVADVAYAKLLAAMLTVFLLYNWTEESYKPTTLVCLTLLLVAMTAPRPQSGSVHATDGIARNQAGVPPKSPVFGPRSGPAARPDLPRAGGRRRQQ